MGDLISIVVPVYNVPKRYLCDCIESILKQSHENLEIIVVDDGSTDGSSEICDYYEKLDNRVKVIHKINGGLSAARNTGVKVSNGKWIMFVDGDDWIERECCQKMYDAVKKHDVQLAMCGMYKDLDNRSIPYSYYIEPEKKYDKEGCAWLQEQVLHNNGNIATAYCKLIKKDVLETNNIYHDEVLRQGAEGIEFNLRLFDKIESAVFINDNLYHYIYNSESISSKHDVRNHEYVLNCFDKIYQFVIKKNNKDLEYWFFNRMLYIIITTAISGYFNPSNKETYGQKKRGYKEYLSRDLVKKSLNKNCHKELSLSRKLVLFLIKHKLFIIVNIMAILRYKQKNG